MVTSCAELPRVRRWEPGCLAIQISCNRTFEPETGKLSPGLAAQGREKQLPVEPSSPKGASRLQQQTLVSS